MKKSLEHSALSAAELHARESFRLPAAPVRRTRTGTAPGQLRKKAIRAPQVLNEAIDYGSAFPRGLRVELPGGVTQLYLSGTASIGPSGETLYAGDFRAQLWRTYHNLAELLASEAATWHDVVRTTCYLRDIERDYADFNSVRNEFFSLLKLEPYPASTAIQARICRSDLLVEIEAVALVLAR